METCRKSSGSIVTSEGNWFNWTIENWEFLVANVFVHLSMFLSNTSVPRCSLSMVRYREPKLSQCLLMIL